MKKVELHIHLDGSLRVSTVADILSINESYVQKKMIVDKNNLNLKEYLTKFELPIKAMQTKENLERVSKELAQDLLKDDVIYAEVRFAPMFHTKEGLSYDDVINSVLSGINSIQGIKINLILCMMRGESFEENLNVINYASKYLNKGVVGIDLAGDEYHYKTADYKSLFELAKEKNIPFTIHAGEADGAKSVYDAISFGAKRIGHGIRSLEDDNLISKLINKKITLEICPTSNIQTKVVNNYNKHPIKKLYDKGVLLTINTDNNTVSDIKLSDEYKNLEEIFNFNRNDFIKINEDAINASFLKGEEKEELLKEYRKEVENELY